MNRRDRGIVKSWRDEKGFGFIAPTNGGADLFFHATSVVNSRRRDLVGQRVSYLLEPGRDGKLCAVDVRLAVAGDDFRPAPYRSRAGVASALIFSLLFLGAVSVFSIQFQYPYIPVAYVIMSVITYAAYCRDKKCAQAGYWRIPEGNLHFLELLGGWPGALIAQWSLPHKNRKPSYQIAFWFIVILHIVVASFAAFLFCSL